ncbi:MAG: S8 family serine peptidase [Pirellulaceae bacterium]
MSRVAPPRNSTRQTQSTRRDQLAAELEALGRPTDQAHGAVDSLLEQCEQRLVLSAQLLAEIIPESSESGVEAPSFFPQLSDAHATTGQDVVSQQFGLSGSGQTVAVIDSGITWDHVALGQGYGPGYRVVGGWDFAENDDQPYDDGPAGFHGTHVAGIIGSDDASEPGVASDVDLVSLRVFNDLGEGQLDWVENALDWVLENQNTFENPITTVNISIGTVWNSDTVPEWGTLEDELQELYNAGIVVTASAGNSFEDYNTTGLSYPASSQYVLPVASVDADGQLSDFSQRHERVLAAPGSAITSTVPDHVLGRDGQYDDFATASGTSMASPYVAGASVLVRQAMEMTGWQDIDAQSITEHLYNTSDSVFDSITGQSYQTLNLQSAIESILPTDDVGDTFAGGQQLNFQDFAAGSQISTWINTLDDQDVYRFTANASGALSLDASSEWVDDLSWSLQASGQQLGSSAGGDGALQLVAGQQYEFIVSSGQSIGPASFDLSFEASAEGAGGFGNAIPLGTTDYLESNVNAGGNYSAVATRDGTFTILWDNPDAASGSLVASAGGQTFSSSEWDSGELRLDFTVQAGQEVQFALPGSSLDSGDVVLANLVSQSGSEIDVGGTLGKEQFSLQLGDQIQIGIGQIEYDFSAAAVTQIQIDGGGNLDEIRVVGSEGIDRVHLRPGDATISSPHSSGSVDVNIQGVEQVAYAGGGGSDRVYLYDSDTDDTLRAYPGRAELTGVGYRFEVEDISRIFIHATGSGQDYAYLYDSSGDDHLSARPQFTSMSGDGFFNYVRGFERVYAYANAGGNDSAELYDSADSDRFLTSGVSASVIGPGFSSYVRNFEQVEAIASAGGDDRATLYGESGATSWQRGSDFVSFDEANWQREARGFESIETYSDGVAFSIETQATLQTTGAETEAGSSVGPKLFAADAVEPFVGPLLHLPEERLLEDPELEQNVVHEVFSDFDRLFEDELG